MIVSPQCHCPQHCIVPLYPEPPVDLLETFILPGFEFLNLSALLFSYTATMCESLELVLLQVFVDFPILSSKSKPAGMPGANVGKILDGQCQTESLGKKDKWLSFCLAHWTFLRLENSLLNRQ